jgi:isocitrate lyase
VPKVVQRINNAFMRMDQIQHAEGRDGEVHWYAPIVADAEAGERCNARILILHAFFSALGLGSISQPPHVTGFGGNLNAYELMRGLIEAGAAAVHFEDQLASAKKCGHMGGKVSASAV